MNPTTHSRRQFDYRDFLRRFRAACLQRGIDPQRGATSFQVVHWHSAQRAGAARGGARWWRHHTLWLAAPPYRSVVEEAAIWNLFMEGYGREMKSYAEAMRRRRMRMPLRELHERQAERRTR